MRTTPRTDAFFRPDAQEYPAARFARQLERENTELIKALEALLPGAESMGWNTDKARAAIAKAKGGNQ